MLYRRAPPATISKGEDPTFLIGACLLPIIKQSALDDSVVNDYELTPYILELEADKLIDDVDSYDHSSFLPLMSIESEDIIQTNGIFLCFCDADL